MLKVHQASLYSITFHYSTSATSTTCNRQPGHRPEHPGKRLTYFRQFILQQPGHQPGHRRLQLGKDGKDTDGIFDARKENGAPALFLRRLRRFRSFRSHEFLHRPKKPFSRSHRQSHYVPARRRRRIGFRHLHARRKRLRCRPSTLGAERGDGRDGRR